MKSVFCSVRRTLAGPFALVSVLVATSTAAVAEPAGAGGPKSLAGSMPAGAIAFAEISDLAPVIDRFRHSSYLRMVLDSPQMRRASKSKQYRKAQAVRKIVERQLDTDLWSLARDLLGERVAIGLYVTPGKKQPDAVALIRVASVETLARVRERLEPVLVLAEDGIDVSETIGGAELFDLRGKAFVAIREDRVVVSSSRELSARAVELAADRGRTGAKHGEHAALADDEDFQAMRRQMGESQLLSVYVSTKMINQIAGGRFVPRKLDEPMASLLFGGLLEMVARSPWGGVTLDAREGRVVLEAGVAGDPEKLGAAYQPFFSKASEPGTPALSRPEGMIAGLTLYRDFAGWYRNRENLLAAKALPGFDKFESGLANLLPGKDFSEDVLPLIGNDITLVSAAQDYSHLDGRPGAQLPGFALVVELAKPREGGDVLRLFFQTLSAILNLQAGQQGREAWVMTSETYGGVQISYGRYLKKPTGEHLPLVFNFMPASAQVGNRFIVSSSLGLCRGLVDELKKDQAGSGDRDRRGNRNFNFQLLVQPLARILEANREFFVAQAIQSGKTLEEAGAQLDAVLEIVRSFEGLRLSTRVQSDGLRLKLEVQAR